MGGSIVTYYFYYCFGIIAQCKLLICDSSYIILYWQPRSATDVYLSFTGHHKWVACKSV